MAEKSHKNKDGEQVTHVISPGSTIRFEEPKSGRAEKHKPNIVVVAREVNPVSGFLGFLREHSVVALAVGFAIATQAQALIKQLITSFIDPLYALVFASGKLSTKTTSITFHGREQAFAWGQFVYTLIDFLFVLLAIFLIVKLFKLDRLEKKEDKD